MIYLAAKTINIVVAYKDLRTGVNGTVGSGTPPPQFAWGFESDNGQNKSAGPLIPAAAQQCGHAAAAVRVKNKASCVTAFKSCPRSLLAKRWCVSVGRALVS